jgi:hypothetical protein
MNYSRFLKGFPQLQTFVQRQIKYYYGVKCEICRTAAVSYTSYETAVVSYTSCRTAAVRYTSCGTAAVRYTSCGKAASATRAVEQLHQLHELWNSCSQLYNLRQPHFTKELNSRRFVKKENILSLFEGFLSVHPARIS